MRVQGVVAALAVVLFTSTASAFDGPATFSRGTMVLSVEAGGGEADPFQKHSENTDLDFWNVGVRFSLLPFGPTGAGPLRGALEVGLEPIYQRYTGDVDAFWAGLAAAGRYHFLSLGRFVPYVEAGAGAGGTDLNVREMDSDHAFLLFAGAGASVFITDRVALYAGYRLQHVSNGGTDEPNRGFESHTGVIGLSTYFK